LAKKKKTDRHTEITSKLHWEDDSVRWSGGGGVGDVRKGGATLKHSGLFAQRPVHNYI